MAEELTGLPEAEKGRFRRINKVGGSRVLAVSTWIPEDWHTVEVEPYTVDRADTVILRIRRIG